MNHLPRIISLHTSERKGVFGSFIDPEWVWHYSAVGTWKFQLEGRSHHIHAGEIVLVPPRVLHVVHPVREGRLLLQVIHFDLPEFNLNRSLPSVVKVPPKSRHELTTLFRAIQEEWTMGQPHRKTIMGGFLAVMIGIYLRNISSQETEESSESGAWKNISGAIHFIHQQFGKQGLTLGDIAAASGLSRNYLCRVFKEVRGISPTAFQKLHAPRIGA